MGRHAALLSICIVYRVLRSRHGYTHSGYVGYGAGGSRQPYMVIRIYPKKLCLLEENADGGGQVDGPPMYVRLFVL